ncbi:MAG: lysozyme inhibitor LprI family protein [Pseudomonadota bacterium]
MIRFAFALVVCATPVAAQDVTFSPVHTQACLDEAVGLEERTQCVGASTTQCMEMTPGGYSTAGEAGCVSAELDWWDARLNTNYKAAQAKAKALDADQMGSTTDVSVATSLRDMQRAWITYRDAKCTYARSQWGGGTGGGPAQLWCMLYETAAQAGDLALEDG